MSAYTLLDRIKRIITGNGFRRVIPIALYDFHLAADGAPLTTTLTTNPGPVKYSTNITSLGWAADKVVAAGIVIQIPEDYDATNDECKLMLKAVMGGSTNTPTITATAYIDSASTTDLAPDATAALSATAAWVEIDLDGNSLTAGDVVYIALTPGTHGTDAIYILSAKLEYRSCLAAYSDTNR